MIFNSREECPEDLVEPLDLIAESEVVLHSAWRVVLSAHDVSNLMGKRELALGTGDGNNANWKGG